MQRVLHVAREIDILVGTHALFQDAVQFRDLGLADAVTLLKDVDGIALCRFTDADGVRHPLVARIVRAYDVREEHRQAERQAAVADLDRLIGDAEASGLAACQTVPVGAKACGGPTDYAVYSAEASEAAAIVQTAEEITRMDEQANREFGLGSDCAVTPEPTVVWVGGQCRAQ